MNKWLLYFLVDDAAGALDSSSLFLADLLAIKDKQLHKPLDDYHPIVGFSRHWVLSQAELQQLRQFGQLFNFKKFLDSVAGQKECLKLLKLLDVRQ